MDTETIQPLVVKVCGWALSSLARRIVNALVSVGAITAGAAEGLDLTWVAPASAALGFLVASVMSWGAKKLWEKYGTERRAAQ